jgi:V/A-type H+-transporting ATPase subunit F
MKVEPIAFLGDRDTVAGFRPLGLGVYPVRDQAEARVALQTARESGCRVLLMTEEAAAWLDAELEEMAAHPLPAVLVVPSTKGTAGLGMQRLRSLVEKAVGADIFSREDQERQR